MNHKYLQRTKSGKIAVVFPRGIKWPRRLGTYENARQAIQARDSYLASVGKIIEKGDETEETEIELSTVDKLPSINLDVGGVVVGLWDLHFPYQDDAALSVVKQILADLSPALLVFAGDCVDFYRLSRFVQDESRANTIQDELDTWHKGAKEILNHCSGAKTYHLPGNHEKRLYSYLCANPQLASLRALQLDTLLGLDSLKAQQAKSLSFLNQTLVFIHGRYISSISGSACKKELKTRGWQQSILQGHGHKTGSFELVGPLRRIEGYEIGCLCQDAWYTPDELPWQRGLAVVTIDAENQAFSVENVKIDNGTAIFRGNMYRA